MVLAKQAGCVAGLNHGGDDIPGSPFRGVNGEIAASARTNPIKAGSAHPGLKYALIAWGDHEENRRINR